MCHDTFVSSDFSTVLFVLIILTSFIDFTAHIFIFCKNSGPNRINIHDNLELALFNCKLLRNIEIFAQPSQGLP